jgi:hypothetical protein
MSTKLLRPASPKNPVGKVGQALADEIGRVLRRVRSDLNAEMQSVVDQVLEQLPTCVFEDGDYQVYLRLSKDIQTEIALKNIPSFARDPEAHCRIVRDGVKYLGFPQGMTIGKVYARLAVIIGADDTVPSSTKEFLLRLDKMKAAKEFSAVNYQRMPLSGWGMTKQLVRISQYKHYTRSQLKDLCRELIEAKAKPTTTSDEQQDFQLLRDSGETDG